MILISSSRLHPNMGNWEFGTDSATQNSAPPTSHLLRLNRFGVVTRVRSIRVKRCGNTCIRVRALRELGAPRAWRRHARLAETRDTRDAAGGMQTRMMIKPCWHAASTRTGKRTSGNREPLHQQRNILFLRILPTDTPIAILRRDVHVRVALRSRQDDRHRVVH